MDDRATQPLENKAETIGRTFDPNQGGAHWNVIGITVSVLAGVVGLLASLAQETLAEAYLVLIGAALFFVLACALDIRAKVAAVAAEVRKSGRTTVVPDKAPVGIEADLAAAAARAKERRG